MKAGIRVRNISTGKEGTVKGIWFNNPTKYLGVLKNVADSFFIAYDDGSEELTSVKVWEMEILTAELK